VGVGLLGLVSLYDRSFVRSFAANSQLIVAVLFFGWQRRFDHCSPSADTIINRPS
jgi:hypothetical protein